MQIIMALPYNLNCILPDYSNNLEYRQCLREEFSMDTNAYSEKIDELHERLGDDLDKETKDENEFDDNAASNAMDYVFSQTKEEPLFQKIYQIAAAKMISTDLQTGLAICFSYDYLGVFHKCLYQYLQNPTEFTKESSCFQSMMKKIE